MENRTEALLKKLDRHKHELTTQEYKTLRGLILHGDERGAMKGLAKLLRRKRGQKNGVQTGKPV